MNEIITDCLSNNLIVNEIYSRQNIVNLLIENDIPENKIPNITSMTYNQWNKGMTNLHLNPIFEYVNRNQYRFLGKKYQYTGDIYNKQIKIGYWNDGIVYDHNNQLANYNFDIELLNNQADENQNVIDFLIEIGFNQTGKYFLENGIVKVTKIQKERVSLVYAFVVNNKVYYFGKTVQGFIRPFSYHKNQVMKTVKEGINEFVVENCEVLIFTRVFRQEDFILWNNLPLNIIESVEQALISKFKPEWNIYRHM